MISSTINFLNKFRERHPATQRRVQDWWAESRAALVCHSASPDEEGGGGNYFAEYPYHCPHVLELNGAVAFVATAFASASRNGAG